MIIIFHAIWFITRYVVSVAKTVYNEKFKKNDECTSLRTKYAGPSEIDFESGTKFFPPVYIQRYRAVKSVLEDEKWKGKLKKVVDFGCAEFGFFIYLKKLDGVTEVLAVDVDYDVLDRHYCKAAPLHTDFLCPRESPLNVYVYKGSIAFPDECLKGCDAVVCIELIEHLYPDVLEDLPYTVFGFIKPIVAIFTTPNGEFNVMFKNFSGFRHPDHKFEWTRKEFECWANNIVLRYPDYTVSFEDIGCDKAAEHLGGCSQMAIFERHPYISSHPDNGALVTEPLQEVLQDGDLLEKYCLLQQYVYPFHVDERTVEQKIRETAVYYIHLFQTSDKFQEDDRSIIPLSCLLPVVNTWTDSMAVLEDILRSAGWQLVEHGSGNLAVLVQDESSSDEYEEELPLAETIDYSHLPKLQSNDDNIWELPEEHGEKWNSESWCTTDEDDCDDFQGNEQRQVLDEQLVQESALGDQEEKKIAMEPPEQEAVGQKKEVGASCISVLFSSSTLDVSSSSLEDTHAPTLTTITEETTGQLDSRSTKDRILIGDNSFGSCTMPSILYEGSGSKLSVFESDEDGEKKYSGDFEPDTSHEDREIKFMSAMKSSQASENNQKPFLIVDSVVPKACDTSLLSHSSPAVVTEKVDVVGVDASSFQLPSIMGSFENILNLFPTCPSPQPCSLSSSSSNNLCLNLQPEYQGDFVSESVGRLPTNESPVAESCSLEEGNDRLADSGYPNSASAQDMDLDLTPEQVEELFTEGDVFADHHADHLSDSVSVSSKDSDSVNEEQLLPPPPPPPIHPPQHDMLFEEAMNVENGDVANNNRDWEGNNAVAAAAMLHDGLRDLRPLLEAAEDLDNDNEIQIHAVEPFPLWLLNLLGLANGGGIGGAGDAPVVQGDDDDDDSVSDPIVDEGLGDEYRVRSNSLTDSVVTDLDVAVESESEGEAVVADPSGVGAAGEPDVWSGALERN